MLVTPLLFFLLFGQDGLLKCAFHFCLSKLGWSMLEPDVQTNESNVFL